METRDWSLAAAASAALGLAAFFLFRAPEKKPKDAPWTRSQKKGENGYYYGHQKTGGYTDGLQASDYAMNGPRKLDPASKKPIEAAAAQTAVNAPRRPLATAPVVYSQTVKRVTRYGWSDTPTAVKISIEDAWDFKAISMADVSIIRPSDTALTVAINYAGASHRLLLTNLRSPLDGANIKIRKKRLLVTLAKRETLLASDRAWPDLFCSDASSASWARQRPVVPAPEAD